MGHQHPPPSVSAAYRDHLGPWAGLGSSSSSSINGNGEAEDDRDEAPLLLQKARYGNVYVHTILVFASVGSCVAMLIVLRMLQ